MDPWCAGLLKIVPMAGHVPLTLGSLEPFRRFRGRAADLVWPPSPVPRFVSGLVPFLAMFRAGQGSYPSPNEAALLPGFQPDAATAFSLLTVSLLRNPNHDYSWQQAAVAARSLPAQSSLFNGCPLVLPPGDGFAPIAFSADFAPPFVGLCHNDARRPHYPSGRVKRPSSCPD